MSSDDSSNAPVPRDRRGAVREKAQLVHAKQSRMRMLRIGAISVSVVVVVAAIAGGVYWAVSSSARPEIQPVTASGDGFPVTVVSGLGAQSDAGAGVDSSTTATPVPQAVPSPSASSSTPPVAVDVYVDYLSPGAKQFQLANVAQLSKWVDQKAVELTYYPVAMLTAKSNGTKYSLRAASAAACVATLAPEQLFAFNDSLLRTQPAADAAGPSDEELATLAIATGLSDPKAVKACIVDEKYVGWVKDATDRALDGIPGTKDVSLTSTPMVLVNGLPYVGQFDDPKEFAQFVMTVSSDAYYKTPTPTPAS